MRKSFPAAMISVVDSTFQRILLLCIPFSPGIRALNVFAASRILQRTVFRRRLAPLRRLLDALQSADRHKEICTHLIANAFSYRFYVWRKHAVAAAKPSHLERHLRIQGLERILHREQPATGVIIVTAHFGVASLLPNLLERTGENVLILSRGNSEKSLAKQPMSANRRTISLEGSFLAQAFLEAKLAVQSGTLVLLLPDGRLGANPKRYPFLDRSMMFQEGFAQLALATGAPVVPVLATVNETGLMTFDIQEPFDPGDPELPRSERCNAITAQYVDWLERCWRRDPGNIHHQWLKFFFEEKQQTGHR